MLIQLAVLGTLGAGVRDALPQARDDGATGSSLPSHVRVRVDSTRHEVVLTLGPLTPPAQTHAEMAHEHGQGHTEWLARFVWPIDGWVRGATVSLLDAGGNPVPRELLHHVSVVHFGRRQLARPLIERLIAIGRETESVMFPSSVGASLARGAPLGFLVALGGGDGASQEHGGIQVELRLKWTPANQAPQPIEARPVVFDVGFRPGAPNTFAVPPGPSVRQIEFTVPTDGRLLAAGGHLHDYGRSLRLEEVATGKVLLALEAKTDGEGRILAVPRKVFGARGPGLRLRKNRLYRVVAEYDNPTDAALAYGGMGLIGGLFAPDDPAAWPRPEPGDPALEHDLLALRRLESGDPTRPAYGAQAAAEAPAPRSGRPRG